MIRKAALTWILMIPVAIANGTFREYALEPIFSDLTAHQLSVVTGSVAFLTLVYLMLRDVIPHETDTTLFAIGVAWVLGTILFELGFGHYVMGNDWERLLHDYNVAEDRLWPVVLAVVMLAPLIVKRMLARHHTGQRPLRMHGA